MANIEKLVTNIETESPYWKFASKFVIEKDKFYYKNSSGKYVEYPASGLDGTNVFVKCDIYYYLGHKGSNGSYYMNAEWKFHFQWAYNNDNKSWSADYVKLYKADKNKNYSVAYSSDFSKYTNITNQTVYLAIPKSVASSLNSIEVKAWMTEDSTVKIKTSPHSTNGKFATHSFAAKDYPKGGFPNPISPCKAGSVTVTDNGNNTYTVTCTYGTAGTRNYFKTMGNKYTSDGSDPTTSTTSNWLYSTDKSLLGKKVSKVFNCPSNGKEPNPPTAHSGLKTTFRFFNYIYSYFNTAANPNILAKVSPNVADVYYYGAPTAPSGVQLGGVTSEGFSVEWSSASKTSNTSLVGITLFVYKKVGSDLVQCPYSVSLDATKLNYTFSSSYMRDNGINSEDNIVVGVRYHSANGKQEPLFGPIAYSSPVTVKGGYAHIFVHDEELESNRCVQGTVFMKINGQWAASKKVYIKVNGEWKESIHSQSPTN